jgi:hypothetical protein
LSELESPSIKRSSKEQSFFNDVFGIGMISLSSEFCSAVSPESVHGPDDLLKSSRMSSETSTSRNIDAMLEQTEETKHAEKPQSVNTTTSFKEIDPSVNASNTLMKRNSVSSPLISNNTLKTSRIWPTGISCQPDFIEFVVTDEEMRAYWDSLAGSF